MAYDNRLLVFILFCDNKKAIEDRPSHNSKVVVLLGNDWKKK